MPRWFVVYGKLQPRENAQVVQDYSGEGGWPVIRVRSLEGNSDGGRKLRASSPAPAKVVGRLVF
jgi:hypothetical protein